MLIQPHAAMRVEKRILGNEGAVLLVIDHLVADPERLVRRAVSRAFDRKGRYFPGQRAPAPAMYQPFLESVLDPLLQEHFGIPRGRFRFSMCHYSLVATPPEALSFLQRVPHIDSSDRDGLATVHYLFRGDWGGTAFYRHRGTGFESIDPSRRETYFRRLEAEGQGGNAPPPGYINGDTALFEQTARADAAFNRMLVYRRNSLHSACIDNDRVPPPDPLAGRLSINTFIDVAQEPAQGLPPATGPGKRGAPET
ncbi:DUF6445 family protein [Fulvimonas sp. R45]|uniref:DUF6445 family protein n=1 Tax=Fulvimonas sp. R45 TaxID=3045937 RepID=UPI00265DD4FA|nr:DUF6445 family protein [Fulvimonas sp. R45]MDO1528390.1 DUF6445 family protein [Fulvimonas sp. R45]